MLIFAIFVIAWCIAVGAHMFVRAARAQRAFRAAIPRLWYGMTGETLSPIFESCVREQRGYLTAGCNWRRKIVISDEITRDDLARLASAWMLLKDERDGDARMLRLVRACAD